MNKVILIGAIREGQSPNCGETMKNQLFIKRFKDLFDEVKTVDTLNWQHKPWILLKIVYILLFNQKASIILSASSSVRHLINILYYFPIHKKIYFWVVGEGLSIGIDKGKYNINALKKLRKIIVQGESMVEELEKRGLNNVLYVPNSKPIIFKPSIQRKTIEHFRFVFLSRIHPDKGIRDIANASEMLLKKGYCNFSIDFYGNIDPSFKEEFFSIVKDNNNLSYKGFLNLLEEKSYNLLSQYDVMLFPTYWAGEAFPGVVIDANIVGIPIIASDWNQNKYVIKDGETGIIIPPHNVKALAKQMELFISKKYDLYTMKKNCNEYVQQFDYKLVLSEGLFKKLGMLK